MKEARSEALATARVWQPLVCLSLLAVMGISAVAVEATIHNDSFGIWMDQKWVEMNDTADEYKRQFLDTEDRIILQDIAGLDPSKGGVYFFGASNMKWSMRTPDLPQAQRMLVHDFGAGEGAPYFHRQFTQYLIDHKGILRAGPDKTLIVYGASFVTATAAPDSPTSVFTNMWRRYGLYRYDYKQGIEPVELGPLPYAYSLEKARISSFVSGLIDRAGRMAVPKAMRRRDITKNAAVYAAYYKRRMGPNWEAEIREHRRELQDWVDYLRTKNVEFKVVLLPLGSWHEGLPYPPKYRAMIEEFCATNHVQLIDDSHILSDDDFLDHLHVNARGLPKTDAAFMDIARGFLKEKGVWPAM